MCKTELHIRTYICSSIFRVQCSRKSSQTVCEEFMNGGSPNIFHFSSFFGNGNLFAKLSKSSQNVPLPPQLVREPLFLHACNEPHLGFYRGPVPHSCHVVIMCSSLRLSSSLFVSLLSSPCSSFYFCTCTTR